MPVFNPRSYLFVPGTRPDRFAKACASGADAVILDLEDSVAPGDKTKARNAIAKWLSAAQSVMVRINTSDSPWFADDLVLGGMPGIAGVLLPKAERVEGIRMVAEKFGPEVPILPQLETARGFRNAQALASANQVRHLLFGSIDFQLDLGMTAEENELLYFRSQIVLESRLANILPPVDGVTTDIHSTELVARTPCAPSAWDLAGRCAFIPSKCRW